MSTGIDKEPPAKKTRSSNAQEVVQETSSRQSQTEATTRKAGAQDQTTNSSNVDTTSEALDEDEVIEEGVGIVADQGNGIDDAGQDGEEYVNETAC
jgi:23S rRNA maturation-related 3'-5' exoribonuclease YhaM